MAAHTEISPSEAADRLAIRELFAAYAHCADRRDAEGQKALFTADTRFAVEGPAGAGPSGAGVTGLEPAASGLTVRCSNQSELHPHGAGGGRWAVTGSNRRPPACKAGALPLS